MAEEYPRVLAVGFQRVGLFFFSCTQFQNRECGHLSAQRLDQPDDIKAVQALIYEHLEKTDSARAKDILDRWDHFRPLFVKVVPKVEPVAVPPEDEPAVEGAPAPGEKVAPVG